MRDVVNSKPPEDWARVVAMDAGLATRYTPELYVVAA
jgi:hypothetical protein